MIEEISFYDLAWTSSATRKARLDIRTHGRSPTTQDTDIIIDSTEIKVYGEAEWKVRTLGVR